MKILDCTLRDGGYYNDWDFDFNLVQRYLDCIDDSGIDIIEIGFRFPPKNKFLGPFAHMSDDAIRRFNLPKCSIAVMINAQDFIDGAKIEDYFQHKSSSPVDLVRIAVHFKDVEKAMDLPAQLKKLGYEVGLNVMQAASRTSEELELVGKIAEDDGNIDVLYLADSFGDMDNDIIESHYDSMRKSWNGVCGFHGHNNKGKGVSNTMYAQSIGVQYLDGTFLGMGRGAGNTEMEYLLAELADKDIHNANPSKIWTSILDDFTPLQNKYKWGPSLLYYISASCKVHPTYVQEFIDSGINLVDILERVQNLGDSGGDSYSFENMNKSQYGKIKPGLGEWDAVGWVDGREVIIVAPGPNGKMHSDQVNKYAKDKNAFVIGLNFSHKDFNIDAYAICHVTRLATVISKIKETGLPVLSPISLLPNDIKEEFQDCNVLDYGISVKGDTFVPGQFGCNIPSMLVAPYAIAAAIAGGASRILLVGFDGYNRNDPRYDEMENVFSTCCKFDIPIFSVTPTLYKSIPQKSIYCMEK